MSAYRPPAANGRAPPWRATAGHDNTPGLAPNPPVFLHIRSKTCITDHSPWSHRFNRTHLIAAQWPAKGPTPEPRYASWIHGSSMCSATQRASNKAVKGPARGQRKRTDVRSNHSPTDTGEISDLSVLFTSSPSLKPPEQGAPGSGGPRSWPGGSRAPWRTSGKRLPRCWPCRASEHPSRRR
jgi:hypothetical protein